MRYRVAYRCRACGYEYTKVRSRFMGGLVECIKCRLRRGADEYMLVSVEEVDEEEGEE